MPHVIVIAGPNGAGKSTAAPSLLKDTVHINDFVNADVIAQGLSAYQPEKAAIAAGRIMLGRIDKLAEGGVNFAFETTLANIKHASRLRKLTQNGYKLHLIFLWLRDVELAISRVADRVKMGGHFIPEVTVRRRYTSGLKNFFNLYKPIADSWQFYDNSEDLTLIASKINGQVSILNKVDWKFLQETYHA